ncbi:MAG TPA: Hpt domain-containing protein, partial [Candidatus Eisenbacteria bacterium]
PARPAAPAQAKAPAPEPVAAKAPPPAAPPPRKSRIKVVELGEDDVVAAEGSDGLPTLDLDHLEEMCMGVATLRDQLLNTYLAEIGPRLERLTVAVSLGQAGDVQREAHGLRGMLGTIGARAGAEMFAALETVATGGDVSAAPALLERCIREADRARAAIEALPFRQKAA